HLGVIFQELELIEYLTAAENILLPFRLSRDVAAPDSPAEHLHRLADQTGISDLLSSYPANLSLGERQRVAICRSLITQPKLLLADEPTGSLDPDNQERIVSILLESAALAGAGLIMVTHDHHLLPHFSRTIDLSPWNHAGDRTSAPASA
ncbi:MAG: ATP-binding cassette domain-containing protein, partial [Verrucomicrobiota bacterium]